MYTALSLNEEKNTNNVISLTITSQQRIFLGPILGWPIVFDILHALHF